MTPALDNPSALAIAEHSLRSRQPSGLYLPGREERPEPDRFQLQFHRSRHTVRCMVLGNGAGKTTVAGVECDWWVQHNHPYQPTPQRGVQVIWVCQKFQQMDELREQLERRCFTAGWTWNENKHRYQWPDGSTLAVFSNDGDWSGVQGINPDLVVVDEECDPSLWRELTMRRRGDKKTRFVISATATHGKRWMYHEIYTPWLKHHTDQGLTEDQAMRTQSHPDYWVWPKGGLLDNPANGAEDQRWYEVALANASPQERQVRLRGGFVDLNQSPVFDPVALDAIEQRMRRERILGTNGTLEPVTTPARLAAHRLPKLQHHFDFIANGADHEGGRITIFEAPGDFTYVLGADFAHGLSTGDFDAAVVLRRGEDNEVHQVAEAHGRWGTLQFTFVLYALGWYFNEALIVGEANSMGLGVLQRLYSELGYVYQYFREARPDSKASPRTDRLGFFKTAESKVIPRLQWAINPIDMASGQRQSSKLHVRSPHLLEELRRYERRPRNKTADLLGTRDKDLVMAAEPGYHDDLVSACAAAVTGWFDLGRFEKPEPQFPTGSLGDVLGHKAVLQPERGNRAFQFAKR